MIERRFEFKYILDPVTALKAEEEIQRWMQIDPAAKNNEYTVTSVYFDSPSLNDYYDKSGGFLKRKKARARIYEPYLTEATSGVWLEVKEKYNMSFVKSRVFVSRDEWANLLDNNINSLLTAPREKQKKEALNKFIWHCLFEGRAPSYFVRYKRRPYVYHWPEKTRVTFDYNVQAARQNGLQNPHFTQPVTKQAVIMEVKFASRLPWFINDIIKKLNLRRTSFSKYARGVDAVHYADPLPL